MRAERSNILIDQGIALFINYSAHFHCPNPPAGSISELKPLGKRGDDRRRSLPALLIAPTPPSFRLLGENGNGRLNRSGPSDPPGTMKTLEPGIRLSVTARTSIVMDAWSRQQRISVHGWIYAIDNGLLRDLGVSITRPEEAPQPIRRGGQESRRPAGCGKTFTVAVPMKVPIGISQFCMGILKFHAEFWISTRNFGFPDGIAKFR